MKIEIYCDNEVFFKDNIFPIQGLLANKLVFISFYFNFLPIECLSAKCWEPIIPESPAYILFSITLTFVSPHLDSHNFCIEFVA